MAVGSQAATVAVGSQAAMAVAVGSACAVCDCVVCDCAVYECVVCDNEGQTSAAGDLISVMAAAG